VRAGVLPAVLPAVLEFVMAEVETARVADSMAVAAEATVTAGAEASRLEAPEAAESKVAGVMGAVEVAQAAGVRTPVLAVKGKWGRGTCQPLCHRRGGSQRSLPGRCLAVRGSRC